MSDIYRYPVFFLRKLVYPASGSRDRIYSAGQPRATSCYFIAGDSADTHLYLLRLSVPAFAAENWNWNRAILARSRTNQAGSRFSSKSLETGNRCSLACKRGNIPLYIFLMSYRYALVLFKGEFIDESTARAVDYFVPLIQHPIYS